MCLRAFLLERVQVWGEREHEKVGERDKVRVRVYSFEALLLCFFPFSPSSQAKPHFGNLCFLSLPWLLRPWVPFHKCFLPWVELSHGHHRHRLRLRQRQRQTRHDWFNLFQPIKNISFFSRNQPKIFNFWEVFGEKKTLLICQNGWMNPKRCFKQLLSFFSKIESLKCEEFASNSLKKATLDFFQYPLRVEEFPKRFLRR